MDFAALRAKIREARASLERPPRAIVILTAVPELSFVASFLALLELGIPIALFSPAWTVPEREIKRALLGSACEHDPAAGQFCWMSPSSESTSSGQLHHPETALVLFTSGSSGAPKAVQLSKRNIEANVHAIGRALDFASAKEQTLFLPLSYSFGLLGQLLPALRTGVPTRFVSPFVRLKALLESGQASGMWSGVPSHWEGILKMCEPTGEPVHGLTHVVSAGAYLSPDLRRRLAAMFPGAVLYNNYGLTEASPRVLMLSSREEIFFTESTGRPIGDWQARLSESGELHVRGDQVMLGYLGDEAETKEKIGDGGWLRSGDMASESEGVYTILERRDQLFNIGGERTSPLEIDNALKRLPGLADAAVWVEGHPIYGAWITAFVVRAPGANPTARGLAAEIAKFLPPVKIPREYYVLDQLPRNANGKLDRAKLGALKSADRKLP